MELVGNYENKRMRENKDGNTNQFNIGVNSQNDMVLSYLLQ